MKSQPANPIPCNSEYLSEALQEKVMNEEVEASGVQDHVDFFMIKYAYGLYRLLPRQVELLANRWKTQCTFNCIHLLRALA